MKRIILVKALKGNKMARNISKDSKNRESNQQEPWTVWPADSGTGGTGRTA